MQTGYGEEGRKRGLDRQLLRWLLGYLHGYQRHAIGVLGLVLLSAMLGILGPMLVQRAIDHFILAENETGLLLLVFVYLGVQLFWFAVKYAQAYSMSSVGQRVMGRLRIDVFSHMLRLPKRYFEKNPTGRLMSRVTTDTEALNELLTSGLLTLVGDVILLVGILITIFIINWQLSLMVVASLPLLVLAFWVFRRTITVLYRRQRTLVGEMNAILQESLVGMPVLQMFLREDVALAHFHRVNEEHKDVSIASVRAFASFFPFVNLLSITCRAIVLWYGGYQYINGAMTLGEIVAFFSYIEMFFMPLRDMSEKFNILQAALAASERVYEARVEPEAPEYGQTDGYQGPLLGRVEFRDVWFAYNEEDWVLRGVSFTINLGETVALVGHTGSGKSTIINLLGRFYEIQKGAIFVDGVNIRDWDVEVLRRSLGFVLQDVFLFSGSVHENVTLYNSAIAREQVQNIIADLGAEHLVDGLQEGLDTPVMERGKSLSVGQRQLLAFARTLCYQPSLLILDEATANVDSETEEFVTSATAKVVEGRTAIVIAHRLSTVREADRILVVHKGIIREQGNHEQLMECKGLYADLYRLQFAGEQGTS